MSGYVRQRDAEIVNAAIVYAEDLKAELDQIQTAMNQVTGHRHNGTTGEGQPILVVGPVQDFVANSSSLSPKIDNTYDLGTASLEYKDLYIDGVANIDSLVADTADINAGTIDATVVGGTTPAAGSFTTVGISGNATVGGTLTVTSSATVNGTTIPASKTLVTTVDTQVLTNKTIDLASNTLVATSAQLKAAITDETGSGALVFATSPTIDAPTITGVSAAPTQAAGDNTTSIATTAHVFAERTNSATLTNKTLTSPAINTATISGGTITGITDLAIADGGTGASTAAQARTNLGFTLLDDQINWLPAETILSYTNYSGVSEIIIDEFNDGIFTAYRVIITESYLNTDGAQLRMTFSSDGGATYLTTAGSYGYFSRRMSGTDSTVSSDSADYMILVNEIGAATHESFHLDITIAGSDRTGVRTLVKSSGAVVDTSGNVRPEQTVAQQITAEITDAIRIYTSSGTIFAKVTVIGLRNL